MIEVLRSTGILRDSPEVDLHPFVQSFTRNALAANGVLFEELLTEDPGQSPNPFRANRERLDLDRAQRCLVFLLAGSLNTFLRGKGNKNGLAAIGLTADEFSRQLYRAWGAEDEMIQYLTELLALGQEEPSRFGFKLYDAIFEHGYVIQGDSDYKRFDWAIAFQGAHAECYRRMLLLFEDDAH